MIDIEKILSEVSKPEIPELRHEEMVLAEIMKARHGIALSWWWSGIPVYVLSAFVMKTFFRPGISIYCELDAFFKTHGLLSLVILVILPAISIVFHFIAIRRLRIYGGASHPLGYLRQAVLHLVLILVSVIALSIYSIIKFRLL